MPRGPRADSEPVHGVAVASGGQLSSSVVTGDCGGVLLLQAVLILAEMKSNSVSQGVLRSCSP